ncbi:MAG TPA: LLM class F420-dependent oxidoreductase [Ktedonobacterales bacterium]|nr:LLM class F420-dependent oxidoreductase [Ktedonobacterales bacterium]
MKLGFHLNDFDWTGGAARTGPTLAEIAHAGDEAGFDRIGVADHFWRSHYMGSLEGPELECYTTLGFLAASTRRAKLTAMVTAATYRQPGLLAKIVTTLDVLSGGRAWLGIGAGDFEAEARGLGLPFPPLKERFEMLEETLQICLRMWEGEHGDDRPYDGRHYHLERALNSPQSLTRPHPPIILGGGGEKTLRLVARYADACNLPPSPDLPRKLETLRRFCDEEGRDYNDIEKTCPFRFDVGEDGGKVSELLGQLRWMAGMGIQAVIGFVPRVDQITPLAILGREVIPAVADL